ncbi:sugar ABC transporter permease [Companilactobacillus paralimentarius DSM 13238 = JCM 10415]|uniref:Sugar ABC transporter permease n=1 Tax=Companilactobacillus paralimentarius DSM 13238 = JCM 10415 TaxID=1122151 RepID=A0A0R1PPB9_9LACO|nr:carbohydrate ABC transporter permease [Companilactobacillus paralimentarius]KAE9562336.1 sugar ABC transporter permease [Companilactobacillus paralimentarius]KRL31733.1 sugar ABC transporter permease [Companilactobacillus paralimentarius DSM 13238 = JCM 10415]MDR4934634.1 carbohydrate ABC transporter permease [Companilactobacillus paralimentarius]QFR68777.1 ABC transporter permease subunit [Companilactobacillus paralimentarius]
MKKKKKIDSVTVHSFSRGTDLFFNIIVGIFALSCLLPLFFVIVISLTDENALATYGYRLWPKVWSFAGYKYLATMGGELLRSLWISVLVTVVGTVINSTFTSTYAYAISRSSFKYRRFFTVFCLVTMLFSPGMVANYIVVTNMLHLKDTLWALILPMAVSPFNIIVMRTFFKRQVSESIIESARIDGASEMRIFTQIVIPLAVPGIATISLFAALGYWNDWFNALLYIQSDNLVPLQYLLMKIQSNIEMLSQNASSGTQFGGSLMAIPKEATRMAMVVIATLPIACSYPFFQKYFVRGLTIGGVKE